MKGFKNVKAYILGQGIITCDIAVENGKIKQIGNLDIDEPYPYSQGQVVLPAFIDQHIHGAGGSDAMDGTVEDLKQISLTLVKEGTVNFLATTMTQSKSNISKALKSIKDFTENPNDGADILGVHLEGPFISEKFKGAQKSDFIVKPDPKTLKDFNSDCNNIIKIVSLAPELDQNHNLIKYLAENNIIASAGHTDSKFSDIESAVFDGLTQITHTYNAQSPLHHRDIGTVGSALLLDELYTELICDLIHLSAPAIKLVVKNKPHDKIIIVTDSMRAKGLPDGISELGGQTVIVKNGEARLENGALAGSVLKMNNAVKNLVLYCGVKFTDAVDFATINPAVNLGVSDRLGSIEIDKDASFTVLDEEFNVVSTIKKGQVVYSK